MGFLARYFGYIEKGVDGDAAADMAIEDQLADDLARFISEQPVHNAPIPYDELRDGTFGVDQGEDDEPEPDHSHTRNDPLCWGQ